MMRIKTLLSGDTRRSRVLRGSGLTIGAMMAQQVIRLGSNLILTRLLAPDAFGLMALITTFMIALAMFSDVGLDQSIIQNKQGGQPKFLNTVWSMQIVRGFVLGGIAAGLAWPLSVIYREPMILPIMLVLAMQLPVEALVSTRLSEAKRNIHLGRVMLLSLIVQLISTLAVIALAWWWESVWALVIGGAVGAITRVTLSHVMMPGTPNRWLWDRATVREVWGFGKFIALGTVFGFVANFGDRLMLGRVITFSDLGIYNIGFFMATLPDMIGNQIASTILFPLFRELGEDSATKQRKIKRAKDIVSLAMIGLFGAGALLGDAVIGFLYDPRYAPAGVIMVLVCVGRMPQAIMVGNQEALMAEGDSRRASFLSAARAVIYCALMVGLFYAFGLFGMLLAHGLTMLLIYPLQLMYLRAHDAADLGGDLRRGLVALVLAVAGVALHWDGLRDFALLSAANAPMATGSWAPAQLFFH